MSADTDAPAFTTPDPWLNRWLPLLAECVGQNTILDIGCGDGADLARLAAAGFKLIGFDLSPQQVALAAANVPDAQIYCLDLRDPFPITTRPIAAVLASLCLHYLPWNETLAVVARIHQLLPPRGLLLCRVNSTEDHHNGASGHPAIADNYFLVDGSPKRFFDQAAVQALFAQGWRFLSLEHYTTHKYELPKTVWEAVLERDG